MDRGSWIPCLPFLGWTAGLEYHDVSQHDYITNALYLGVRSYPAPRRVDRVQRNRSDIRGARNKGGGQIGEVNAANDEVWLGLIGLTAFASTGEWTNIPRSAPAPASIMRGTLGIRHHDFIHLVILEPK